MRINVCSELNHAVIGRLAGLPISFGIMVDDGQSVRKAGIVRDSWNRYEGDDDTPIPMFSVLHWDRPWGEWVEEYRVDKLAARFDVISVEKAAEIQSR